MRPRRMSDVARAVDGMLIGEDVEVTSVTTDSRYVTAGALFVALPGERTDGAKFVADALAGGAAGVLGRDGTTIQGPAVFVRSTGEALTRLASDERLRMDATVIAITGANGKTTTKDLAAAVLSTALRTHVVGPRKALTLDGPRLWRTTGGVGLSTLALTTLGFSDVLLV